MTNIVLQKIEFNNMFSYGNNNVLQLDKNKITQLTGANGLGKTSLVLILQEILFSKNIKNIKKADILNRYIKDKEWDATLTFKVDDNDYILKVNRKGSTSKVTLIEDDLDISEHKIPDTYKLIQEIFNSNFEVFSQLTYQSSTDSLEFLKATDSNRKKFLIKLFNLEKYLEIGENIKVKLSKLEKELLSKQGELKAIENFIESTVIGNKLELLEVPTIDISNYTRLEELTKEFLTYKDTCKKIDQNNLYVQERDYLEFDMSMIIPENPVMVSEYSIDNLPNLLGDINSIIKDINKQKSEINDLDLSDICYTCGQSIDNSQVLVIKDNLQNQINKESENKEKLTNITDKLKTIKRDYDIKNNKFIKNKVDIKEFEHLSQLIDSTLSNEYPDYSELNNNIVRIRSIISKEEKAVEEVIKINDSIKLENNKVDTLIQQKREFLVGQQLLNSDIILFKDKVNCLTILKKAFSTSGLIAYKLEGLTKTFEQTINKYLAEFSDGQFQINFKLIGEKLNIQIFNEGIISPIETMSGGEFSRIQMSILLSIRKLLSDLGGSFINLLFLDEITGVLDEAGKEKLIEILSEEENLNVFLISHDFNHPLISKLEIVKKSNISEII